MNYNTVGIPVCPLKFAVGWGWPGLYRSSTLLRADGTVYNDAPVRGLSSLQLCQRMCAASLSSDIIRTVSNELGWSSALFDACSYGAFGNVFLSQQA
jgi:hypothetical protein